MPSKSQQQWSKAQQAVCAAAGVGWQAIDWNCIVGVADHLGLSQPTHGLRHAHAGDTSGWFLWSGEFSAADDFFKPYHLWHVVEVKPEIIRYLALPPGFRFLIDDAGYEDVWFDDALLLP